MELDEDLDTADDSEFEAFQGLIRSSPSSEYLPQHIENSRSYGEKGASTDEQYVSPESREQKAIAELPRPPPQTNYGEVSKGTAEEVPKPNIEITKSDFLFGRTLGEGAYARVVHARLKSMQTDYAMKIQEKAHIKKHKKVSCVLMEKDILIKYSHPMIIKLYYCFTDPFYIYMCMDLAPGGELTSLINSSRAEKAAAGKENEACDLVTVQFYAAELVEALEYLHGHNIVHRDLKPENVLITATGHIKLADFGAALIGEDRDYNFEGTALYLSPEIMNSQGCTGASDLWALGCIIYQMITGKTPFGVEANATTTPEAAEYLIFENISRFVEGSEAIKWPDSVLNIAPGESAKSVVESLLRVDPAARLGAGTDEGGNGYGHLKGHEFWGEYVKWEDLLGMTAPFTPDPKGFPSSEELADGADDEWMIEGEATIIEESATPVEIAGRDFRRKSAEGGALSTGRPEGGTLGALRRNSLGFGASEVEHWTSFLLEGEEQLFSGITIKRKGLFSKKRLLILTNHPRLFYVDPDTNEMKGEIPWTAEYPVQCSILDEHKFDILSTRSRRVYHLCDREVGSKAWVDLINAMVEKQQDNMSA